MKKSEVMFTVLDAPPLLECEYVDAVCVAVETSKFRPFMQTKFVFWFEVFDPDKYAGTRLEMFARVDPRWKSPPRSSKLYRQVCIAVGRLKRGQKITKTMFTKKAFRCRLRTVGEGPSAYSVVDTISENLAG